jgi:hypothetical protein
MIELLKGTKRKQPNALVLTSNLRIVDGVKQESKKEAMCFNGRINEENEEEATKRVGSDI